MPISSVRFGRLFKILDATATMAGVINTGTQAFSGDKTLTGSGTVDNIKIDGNVISSVDTNGDINLTPNGSGGVVVGGSLAVDNLLLNGNVISSTDANGDINLTPNGSGGVVVGGDLTVDNLKLDGNVLSATDFGGDLTLTPGTNGTVIATAELFAETTKRVACGGGTTGASTGDNGYVSLEIVGVSYTLQVVTTAG